MTHLAVGHCGLAVERYREAKAQFACQGSMIFVSQLLPGKNYVWCKSKIGHFFYR